MKKSEYKRWIAAGFKDLARPTEYAADLAERAGAKWDPEEPELPKRLSVEFRTLTVPDESGSRYASEREVREAVARYNAWERLCRLFEYHRLPGEAERFLTEERERLR